MKRIVVLAVLLAACAGGQPDSSRASESGATRVAITHATVIDVESGARLADQTVIIAGSRITSMGPSADVTVPDDATVVDGTGRFVIPGLWDMHAHLDGTDVQNRTILLPLLVANGVTGVREMWSDCVACEPDSALGTVAEQVARLRADVRAGRQVGPQLVLASAPLDGPNGPDQGLYAIRSEAEAKAAVEDAAGKEREVVGTYGGLGPAAYTAAAAAAKARGLTLAGPAPLAVTDEEMRAAGQRTRDNVLEWIITCSSIGDSVRTALRAAAVADALAPPSDTSSRFWPVYDGSRDRLRATLDRARCEQAARIVAGHAVWQVPRLIYNMPSQVRREGPLPEAKYFWGEARTRWERKLDSMRTDASGAIRRAAALEEEIVGILHAAGVPLLLGTESYSGAGVWGFTVHDELAALVGAGLSPLDALRTATVNAARALGRDAELGTVAKGKLADLVLLDADPLTDIRATSQIYAVVLNGRLFTRADLDQLLSSAETAAQAR